MWKGLILKKFIFFIFFIAIIFCVQIFAFQNQNIEINDASSSVLDDASKNDVSKNENSNNSKTISDTDVSKIITPEPEPITLPWYLMVVNKENIIDENYTFEKRNFGGKIVSDKIFNHLNDMLVAAKNDGANIWVASGFRSVETQESVFTKAINNRMRDYNMTYDQAREHALTSIALPGYSEHHTGLCVDFNSVTRDFEFTKEYEWLQANAAKYGFVQRYYSEKEDITGYVEEVWHYRYVGSFAAEYMTKNNLCLEEYVELYLSGEF